MKGQFCIDILWYSGFVASSAQEPVQTAYSDLGRTVSVWEDLGRKVNDGARNATQGWVDCFIKQNLGKVDCLCQWFWWMIWPRAGPMLTHLSFIGFAIWGLFRPGAGCALFVLFMQREQCLLRVWQEYSSQAPFAESWDLARTDVGALEGEVLCVPDECHSNFEVVNSEVLAGPWEAQTKGEQCLCPYRSSHLLYVQEPNMIIPPRT